MLDMYIPQYQASWPHTVSSVHASLHLGAGSIPAMEVHHPSMPPCQGWWLHSRGITRQSCSWLDYVQPPSNYLSDAVLHSCRRTQSRYRNGWFVYFSRIFIFSISVWDLVSVWRQQTCSLLAAKPSFARLLVFRLGPVKLTPSIFGLSKKTNTKTNTNPVKPLSAWAVKAKTHISDL